MWNLNPCRLAAAPPWFHGCVMAPFHFPPPLASRSPPGHRSQAGALATRAGLGVAEMNGRSCGAGGTRQLEKRTPWGTEQPAASRAQMDPRAGTRWVPFQLCPYKPSGKSEAPTRVSSTALRPCKDEIGKAASDSRSLCPPLLRKETCDRQSERHGTLEIPGFIAQKIHF